MPQAKPRFCAAVLNLPTLWLLRKSECAGAKLLRLPAQRKTGGQPQSGVPAGFSKKSSVYFCQFKKKRTRTKSQIQGGGLATQGKRRLRSRFLTAMSKTAVRGARTPYYGDAHIAPFTPAPAVLNLSLATSAGECAEAILLPSPRRGRMCASCRQPRCGFRACPNLRNCHMLGNLCPARGEILACKGVSTKRRTSA